MDNLKSSLNSLECNVGKKDYPNCENVLSVIEAISLGASQTELGVIISDLFNGSSNVINILKDIVSEELASNVKCRICNLLEKLCTKAKEILHPYCISIKDALLGTFTCAKSALVKSNVLSALSQILILSASLPNTNSLEIDKLVQKLFSALDSRPTDKVFHGLLIILGIISKHYSQHFHTFVSKLEDRAYRRLKSEMTSTNDAPKFMVVASCYECLNYLYEKFPPKERTDSKDIDEILDFGKKILKKTTDSIRYAAIRNVCLFLSNHAALCSEFIIKNAEDLFDYLLHWCNHKNSECKSDANKAIHALIKEVALHITRKIDEIRGDQVAMETDSTSFDPKHVANSLSPVYRNLFTHFLKQFMTLIDSENTSTNLTTVAIRGLGYFVRPCSYLLPESDNILIHNKMAARVDHLFHLSHVSGLDNTLLDTQSSPELLRSNLLYQLPSLLEALASVIASQCSSPHLTFTHTNMTRLVKLSRTLFEAYPHLSGNLAHLCKAALLSCIFSFREKAEVMGTFLDGFMYHAVICTCSHPPPIIQSATDQSDNKPGEWTMKELCYEDYIPLWTQILTVDTYYMRDLSLSRDEKDHLRDLLYDHLISSVITLLDRLDLSYRHSQSRANTEEEIIYADPTSDVEANTPKDFEFLVNLVDCLKSLLNSIRNDRLTAWLDLFLTKCVTKSTKYPLVSGFYRLLSIALKLSSQLNFFSSEDQDHSPVIHLIASFARNVLVALKQYKEDLLASCLMFLLSLPRHIVISSQYQLLPDLLPALRSAISIGASSYLPLATASIDALEVWTQDLTQDQLHHCLPQLLPCFEHLMRSQETTNHSTGRNDDVTGVMAAVSGRRDKRALARSLRAIQAMKRRDKLAAGWQSQLLLCQMRLVKFVGELGQGYGRYLLSDETKSLKSSFRLEKGSLERVKIYLPFQDLKPALQIDSFIPPVMRLATSCMDRATKLCAAELLHSLIAVMLSTHRDDTLVDTWCAVLPVIIQLACDLDTVCRELYKPLLYQLIHYFTGVKTSPKVTGALLESLIQSLVHSGGSQTDSDHTVESSGASQRDLAAHCLHEFLSWSLRQQKSERRSPTKSRPEGPDSEFSQFEEKLLKRICTLARHPSPSYRLGAALAFNSIYTLFREEERLVLMYVFEILVNFVESLVLAEEDDSFLGTQQQCVLSLKHLQRILLHYATKLNGKPTPGRHKPPKWSGANYEIAVRWLLSQCGRPQAHLRHACIELVQALAGGIEGCKGQTANFFSTLFKTKGTKYFIHKFESPDLLQVTTDPLSLNLWMRNLLASLECYCWVLQHQLLKLGDLFCNSGGESGKLMPALRQFIETVLFGENRNWRELDTSNRSETHSEIEMMNKLRATVTVRVMNFLCLCVHSQTGGEFENIFNDSFFSQKFWKMIASAQFRPVLLGFNMADLEVISKLPAECETFVSILDRLPLKYKSSYIRAVKSISDSLIPGGIDSLIREDQECHSDSTDPNDQEMIDYFLISLCHLSRVKHLRDQFNAHLVDRDSMRRALQGIARLCSCDVFTQKLDPTMKNRMSKVLKCILSIDDRQEDLLTLLFGPSGKSIIALFGPVIQEALIVHSTKHVTGLLKFYLKEESALRACNLLEDMLEFTIKEKDIRKEHCKVLVREVAENWHFLHRVATRCGAVVDVQLSVISIITKLVLLSAQSGFLDQIFDTYVFLLEEAALDIGDKIRLLDILAYILSAPALKKSDNRTTELKTALNNFTVNNFPIKSTEFPSGSKKQVEMVTAIKSMLSALELTGSQVLIEILIPIFCREESHLMDTHLQNALIKMVSHISRTEQQPLLMLVYRKFHSTDSASPLPPSVRLNCLEKFCLPLMAACWSHSVESLFVTIIKEVVHLAETDSPTVALEERLGGYLLLTSMYNHLEKSQLHSPESRVNRALASDPNLKVEGKEMTKRITVAARKAAYSDLGSNPFLSIDNTANLSKLKRRFHSAAYSCLAAVIILTQTEGRFFVSFLLREEPTNNMYFLENMVPPDSEGLFTFSDELERPLEKKHRFFILRQNLHHSAPDSDIPTGTNENEEGQPSPSSSSPDGINQSKGSKPQPRYMPSQYLSDSSLSMELSHFDRMQGNQILLPDSQSSDGQAATERLTTQSSDSNSLSAPSSNIELEMDSVNQVECMPVLVTLLRHLQKLHIITPLPTGCRATVKDLPTWMNYFYHKMVAMTTPINVKIFIAKLVINCSEFFQPYADIWLTPLLKIILNDPSGTFLGYTTLNVDLLVTLLSWSELTSRFQSMSPLESESLNVAEEKRLISRLLENLVLCCRHESNHNLTRNNLEIVKTLVESWRGIITMPTKSVYRAILIPKDNPKDTRSATGLQLLGVFLANKLSFLNNDDQVESKQFLKGLCDNFSHSYKQVYAAAFEVSGIIMAQCKDPLAELPSFVEALKRHLSDLSSKRLDTFVSALSLISRSYPNYTQHWMNSLRQKISRMDAPSLAQTLQLMTNAVDTDSRVYLELKSAGVFDNLHSRSSTVLLSAFPLIHRLLTAHTRRLLDRSVVEQDNGEEAMCTVLVRSVLPCARSPQVMVRREFYELMKNLFLAVEEMDKEKLCRASLLSGLSDPDQSIRVSLHNFWSSPERLSTLTKQRAHSILKEMFSASSESAFLQYSTSLLMEMCSLSPDYHKPIADRPLTRNAEFTDANVEVSSRQRHSMCPLFLQSGASQSSQSVTNESAPIRATQATNQLAFAPTQQAAPGSLSSTFDWLTEDTLSVSSSIDYGSSGGKANLIGDLANKSSLYVVKKSEGSGRRHDSKPNEAEERNIELKRLRRRFLRERIELGPESNRASSQHDRTRAHFIKKHYEKLKAADQSAKASASEDLSSEAAGGQLRLYRSYRRGDFPDVEVPYRSVIAPLQALARLDVGVAGLLFTEMYSAIYKELISQIPDSECVELERSLQTGLEFILTSSATYPPDLIASCLDLALRWNNMSAASLRLEPQICATAAIESNQQALGALLLEEYLMEDSCNIAKLSESTLTPPTSKRPRYSENVVNSTEPCDPNSLVCWELIRVYRSVMSLDDVIGLLRQWPDCSSAVQALQAEATDSYEEAKELYAKLLSDGIPGAPEIYDNLTGLYQEGLLSSLNALSSWSELNEVAPRCANPSSVDDESQEGNNLDLKDLLLNQTNILSKILRAKLKRIISDRRAEDSEQELLDFLDSALTDEQMKPVLESRFSSEISLLYIWQDEFTKAKYYCEQAVKDLCQSWNEVGNIMNPTARSKCEQIQPLTEMSEFLHTITDPNNFRDATICEKVMSTWVRRGAHSLLDSGEVWDDLITNRRMFLDILDSKLLSDSNITLSTSEPTSIHFQLSQTRAALMADNTDLAFSLLGGTYKRHRRMKEFEIAGVNLWISWSHLYADACCIRAESGLIEATPSYVQGLVKAYENLNKMAVMGDSPSLKLQHSYHKGYTLEQLAAIVLSSNWTADSIQGELREKKSQPKISELIGVDGEMQQHELASSLIGRAFRHYQENIDQSQEHVSASANNVTERCQAFMKLADFTDNCFEIRSGELTNSSAKFVQSLPTAKVLIEANINAVLSAMKLEDVTARLKFARTLQLVEKESELYPHFIKLCESLPSWMFILWIDQILGYLDKPESSLVLNILERVSDHYPNSLVYPYKTYVETFDQDKASRDATNLVTKLRANLIKLPLVDQFLRHLEQLNHPIQPFKDWRKLYQSALSPIEKKKAVQEFKQIYQNLFTQTADNNSSQQSTVSPSKRSKLSSSLYGEDTPQASCQIPIGKYRMEIANKLADKNVELLTEKDWKLFSEIIQSMEKLDVVENPPTNLSEYSTWLANFNSSEMLANCKLEVPGQYSGWSKPIPERHHMVASFHSELLILKSMQRPKRLTIICSDAIERNFLVKGGEDLRQDSRIQQCFYLANHIINNSSRTRKHHIVPIRCYTVIPLTQRLGLLSWMENTAEMKELVYGALNSRKKMDEYSKVRKQHHDYIWNLDKQNQNLNYCKSWSRVRPQEMEKRVKNIKKSMEPCDYLRQAFLTLSANSQGFYQLRSRFIRSYASLSALHYILGIGDRHLSNFLICKNTGDLVGIDFGYAFGVSTVNLPVPELVPLRITWTLDQFMRPQGPYGTYQQHMTRVLAAMRDSRQLLMATLQVFMKQQSADWKLLSKNTKLSDQSYASERINAANSKLLGRNPAELIINDVRIKNANSDWFKHLEDYLKDLAAEIHEHSQNSHSESGVIALECSTGYSLRPADQAKALIQLGTSYQLLGRAYAGWEPFL